MSYIVNVYRCTTFSSRDPVDMTPIIKWYEAQCDKFPWKVHFGERNASIDHSLSVNPVKLVESLAELSKQFKKCNMYNSDVMVYDCTEFMKDPDLYYYHGGCIRINVTESENSIILNQYYTDGRSVETRF